MIKTLSLFTGGGGLDIGFHLAGFEIVSCVEMNTPCCKTLETNKPKYVLPECQISNADIRDVQPEDIGIDKCEFIIGGPPCQSFSAAGRRAGGITGINDRRGTLFEHYCRFIEHFQPRGFLFENVRGILSANKSNDWQQIHSTFESLGYNLFYRILDAADFGVPQHRERLIMIGIRKCVEFLFPAPAYGPDSKGHRPYITCGEAIKDLQNPNEPVHKYGGKYGELLGLVPPGQNYLYFTKEMGYPEPVFAWRSRFSDFLYKASPESVTKTIVARQGAFSGPFHWKNRKFTLPEFKRLFTFPDDYQLYGGTHSGIQQLGNSVAPAFAKHLALAVLKQVFKAEVSIDLIPTAATLSFDRRKGDRAKQTRRRRLQNSIGELSLFSRCKDVRDECPSKREAYHVAYRDWKHLVRNEAKSVALAGKQFKVCASRRNGNCIMTVTVSKSEAQSKTRLVTCRVRFHNAIGDGLKSITCSLRSSCDEDVVALWDAVEHYLCSHSSYLSMMDVFGHFTEPHPLFDLDVKIAEGKDTFLLRFVKFFSDFTHVAVDYPVKVLAGMHDEQGEFKFLDTVKWLRSLRLDVRVYETNSSIPPGFFRCCYPFPLHVDKQAAISWVEKPDGNQEYVARY